MYICVRIYIYMQLCCHTTPPPHRQLCAEEPCAPIYVYAYVYKFVHKHIYVYVYTHMCAYMFAYIHCSCVVVPPCHLIENQSLTKIYMYMHRYINVYMCIYLYTCIRMHIYIYMCAYIRIQLLCHTTPPPHRPPRAAAPPSPSSPSLNCHLFTLNLLIMSHDGNLSASG